LKQQHKPTQKKKDKRKVFISIMAGFMVLCMIIPMVSMILTYGVG
jgi:ferric iron reductase protein FhuF